MINDKDLGYFYIIKKEFQEYFYTSNENTTLFTRPEICGNRNLFPFIYDRVKKGLPVCLDWHLISSNPNHCAIKMLKENISKIHWALLSANPCKGAVEILKEYPHKIDWIFLSSNWCSEAVDMLLDNPEKICWPQLCRNKNPRVISFLESQLISCQSVAENKIDWYILSGTHSYEAIALLSRYLHKLDNWYALSGNPFAIELLEKHRDKIIWKSLSSNPHPRALEWLMEHPDKIDVDNLCCNSHPLAIQLLDLEEYHSKINWYNLSSNSSAIGLLARHKDKLDLTSLLFNQSVCRIM
jgi:hypothetical protein